jgi:hypothetical protein
MKIRTKAPNFALTKELNENTNTSTKFWLKVLQDWALMLTMRSIQFCHANNKQVIMRCCSCDWEFAKLDSPRRLVQFWQNFQTSLVLLIPNCTRHRMITYTYTLVAKGSRKFRLIPARFYFTRGEENLWWHAIQISLPLVQNFYQAHDWLVIISSHMK